MNTMKTAHSGSEVTTSLTLDSNIFSLLDQALLRVEVYLDTFASDPYFAQKLAHAFGDGKNIDELQADWQEGDFGIIPSLQILGRRPGHLCLEPSASLSCT